MALLKFKDCVLDSYIRSYESTHESLTNQISNRKFYQIASCRQTNIIFALVSDLNEAAKHILEIKRRKAEVNCCNLFQWTTPYRLHYIDLIASTASTAALLILFTFAGCNELFKTHP